MIDTDELELYHARKNHSVRTRQLVRAALRHWRSFGLSVPHDDALALYHDNRLSQVAADTVRGELTKLIALANYLGFSPVIAKPRAIERCPEAWTRSQLRKLFRAVRRTKRTIWGMPGSVYWPALLGVTYDTGERIGAVLTLQASDIDSERRRVLYRAEVRKGGYRDAAASLSRRTIRDVGRLLELAPAERLFVRGSESTVWPAYTRILRDAGLPCDRRSKFHRLRRTHATFIHLAGGDATAAMGHRSDATTRAHYLDWQMIGRQLPWRPWW